jgi:hypothetical protein
MACLAKIRNTMLDAQVESVISDATASSLGAATAAALALHKVNGVSTLQVLTAAIYLFREQAVRHRETVDELTDEIAGHEDEVSDLKIEIGNLHAKLKKATAGNASGVTP